MEPLHTPKTLSEFPVSPGRWPVVGHLPSLYKHSCEHIVEYADKLGDAFWITMGGDVWTLVVSGKAARNVMKNRQTRSTDMGSRVPHITSDTMLVNDGDTHKRMRGSMNAPFTPKGISVAKVGAVIGSVMELQMKNWDHPQSISILDATNIVALNVIFRILGVPEDELVLWRKKFNEFLPAGLVVPLDFPGSPVRKSKQAADWLDTRFGELLEKARQNGETDTMLGALAHGKDEQGRSLSERELLSNLRLLGLAGHETTASTMAWMMMHAAENAEIWERVCEEANAQEQPPLAPKELANFPYAEALFRECLRLYPPLGLLPPRRVVEPFEVGDKIIPPNTLVSASIFGLSMDPEEYPEPHEVRPERWIGRKRKPGPAESVQFGGGPHFCLGYHLALLEGVQFIVYAARLLTARGLRPTLSKPLPKPLYLPLTRPPKKAEVILQSV